MPVELDVKDWYWRVDRAASVVLASAAAHRPSRREGETIVWVFMQGALPRNNE